MSEEELHVEEFRVNSSDDSHWSLNEAQRLRNQMRLNPGVC